MTAEEELELFPSYHMDQIQNELFRIVDGYMKEHGLDLIGVVNVLGMTVSSVKEIHNGLFHGSVYDMLTIVTKLGYVPRVSFERAAKVYDPDNDTELQGLMNDTVVDINLGLAKETGFTLRSDKPLVPSDFSEYDGDDIMSNFHDLVVQETADHVKGKKLFSPYAGRNFYGMVWWQDDKWLCDVWSYGEYKETVVKDTLPEIMKDICSKYGND